jgi:fatty acid desaturase
MLHHSSATLSRDALKANLHLAFSYSCGVGPDRPRRGGAHRRSRPNIEQPLMKGTFDEFPVQIAIGKRSGGMCAAIVGCKKIVADAINGDLASVAHSRNGFCRLDFRNSYDEMPLLAHTNSRFDGTHNQSLFAYNTKNLTGLQRCSRLASVIQTSTLQIDALVSRRRLLQFKQRTNRHASLFLARHLAIIAATGGLVWATTGTFWLLPAMFLHGLGIVHLFAAQHEFAHRTAFRTRWLNDVLGGIFGTLIMLPHVYFRWEHTDHHTYTQDTKRDPQLIPQPRSLRGYFLYLSSIPYWIGFLRPFVHHLRGHLNVREKRFVPASEHWKVIREARVMFAVYLAVALISLYFRTLIFLQYWLIPRLLAEPFMRFIRMTEHVGRPVDHPDCLQNSRTCHVWPPLRWLAWNMPYHAEHHLSSGVPFHALPALSAELPGQRTICRGYRAAHREILLQIHRGTDVSASVGRDS